MLRTLVRPLPVAVMTMLAVPATAAAAGWSLFGGDPGRSGNQPVGDGTAPVRALYSKADAGVQTSIVTSAGGAGVQRLAYGTADGRVHLRLLASGAAVGPGAGSAVDDGSADADVFGGRPGSPPSSSVGFVDTSRANAPGQLLVVHNDDGQGPHADIAIAQIDASTGALVKQHAIDGTKGFTIRSSPVVTAADGGDTRVLFFVASAADDERLFRVPVANGSSTSASFGVATSTPDVDANVAASPTLLSLRDPAGRPRAFVAIGSAAPASAVKTFAADDLAPGPASGDLGDVVATPSVPARPDGSAPSPGGAPPVYVAAQAGGSTVVHRLVQYGNTQQLSVSRSSAPLSGAPAPALATSVEALPTGPTRGRVVVTTSANLYILDGGTLGEPQAFSSSPLAPGTSGFSQTTAAVSGELVYATTDDGRQLVLRLRDAQPVAPVDFTQNPVNDGARPAGSAFGQPAVSRSFVQFAGPKGIFVYVNRCGDPVVGTEGADQIVGTVAGESAEALGGDDRVSAAASDDCVRGGGGNDALSGNEGEDRISAQPGDDRVYGRTGNDAVSGNEGRDVVSGGPGDDVVYGREDDDLLSGNAGNDRLLGGTGDDRLLGRGGDDALTGSSGNDQVSGSGGDDRAFGRTGDDGVSGNAGNDRVSGGSGDDRVFGRTGDDGVSGNAGNDRIDGGSGHDRLFGRGGSDFVDARDGERDLVYCGTGRDTVRADRLDVLRACERVSRR